MKMKKLFCFLSLSALLAACDGDENTTPYNPNAADSNTLIRKTIETFDDGETLTTTFHYDGFKMANFTDTDGGSGVFTYANDQLVKIEHFSGTTLEQTDLFTYNSAGKIIAHKELLHLEDTGTRQELTHNANGTIDIATFHGNLAQQNNPGESVKLFFTGSEITKKQLFTGSALILEEMYEYDNLNNPWRNVVGLNMALALQGEVGGILHNLTSTSGTTSPVSITYSYDTFTGFPAFSESIGTSDSVTTEYIYE